MIPQPGGLGDRCAKIWVSGVRRGDAAETAIIELVK